MSGTVGDASFLRVANEGDAAEEEAEAEPARSSSVYLTSSVVVTRTGEPPGPGPSRDEVRLCGEPKWMGDASAGGLTAAPAPRVEVVDRGEVRPVARGMSGMGMLGMLGTAGVAAAGAVAKMREELEGTCCAVVGVLSMADQAPGEYMPWMLGVDGNDSWIEGVPVGGGGGVRALARMWAMSMMLSAGVRGAPGMARGAGMVTGMGMGMGRETWWAWAGCVGSKTVDVGENGFVSSLYVEIAIWMPVLSGEGKWGRWAMKP